MEYSLSLHWLPVIHLAIHSMFVVKSEHSWKKMAGIIAVNLCLIAYFTFLVVEAGPLLEGIFNGSRILFLWSPIVFFWWVYIWTKHTFTAFHPANFSFDEAIIRFEQQWFGQPSLWWARNRGRLLTETMQFFYFTYFFYTFSLGLYLHYNQRIQEFQAMAFAVTLGYLVSYSFFAITPVQGPRWALVDQGLLPAAEQRQHGYVITRLVERILYDDIAHKGGAMPSAHSSTAVVFAFWCWRIWGVDGGVPALTVALGMGLGAVYGRYHYLVDVIVGAFIGIGTLLAAEVLVL